MPALTICPGTPYKAWLNFPKREDFSWTTWSRTHDMAMCCSQSNHISIGYLWFGLQKQSARHTHVSICDFIYWISMKISNRSLLKSAKLHSHRSDSWTGDVCTHTQGCECNVSISFSPVVTEEDSSVGGWWRPKISRERDGFHHGCPPRDRWLSQLFQPSSSICSAFKIKSATLRFHSSPLWSNSLFPSPRWACSGVTSPIATSCHSNPSKCVQ